MKLALIRVVMVTCLCLSGQRFFPAAEGDSPRPPVDWLVDPTSFKAIIRFNEAKGQLSLENGLVRRVLRIAPNAATIDYKSLTTGEQLLRATGPEARVTLQGVEYSVGGLDGQPVQNYLKAEWIDELRAIPNSYQFTSWKEEPLVGAISMEETPRMVVARSALACPGKAGCTPIFTPCCGLSKVAGKSTVRRQLHWKTRSELENPRQPETPPLNLHQ